LSGYAFVVAVICLSAYPIFVQHTILKISQLTFNVLNCCQTGWRLFALADGKCYQSWKFERPTNTLMDGNGMESVGQTGGEKWTGWKNEE